MNSHPHIHNFSSEPLNACFLMLAAGFEDRSFEFISNTSFDKDSFCLLILFNNSEKDNNKFEEKYLNLVNSKFSSENILHIHLDQSNPKSFDRNASKLINSFNHLISNTYIDISGMPTHVIFSILRSTRLRFPNLYQHIIYTSAKEYFPSFNDYKKLKESQSENIEYLPKSMALEMSEVLILESFLGHRTKEGVTCLAVFAGYEAHRSIGVIDSINPSTLLLIYGTPGNIDLKWRLDLSKQLHNKFELTRKSSTEIVSTLDPNETIKILDEYYHYLFEDYDFTIAPVCSKMQAVGIFLFWEKYKEIQLAFPLPIGYSLEHSPKGVEHTYIYELSPLNSLYHSIDIE